SRRSFLKGSLVAGAAGTGMSLFSARAAALALLTDPTNGLTSPGSRFGAVCWGGLRDKSDHAGAVFIPQSTPAEVFDHSSYGNARRRHGRGRFPGCHGSVDRSVAAVLRADARPGGGGRCCYAKAVIESQRGAASLQRRFVA